AAGAAGVPDRPRPALPPGAARAGTHAADAGPQGRRDGIRREARGAVRGVLISSRLETTRGPADAGPLLVFGRYRLMSAPMMAVGMRASPARAETMTPAQYQGRSRTPRWPAR